MNLVRTIFASQPVCNAARTTHTLRSDHKRCHKPVKETPYRTYRELKKLPIGPIWSFFNYTYTYCICVGASSAYSPVKPHYAFISLPMAKPVWLAGKRSI
jgi:hypothetical protein